MYLSGKIRKWEPQPASPEGKAGILVTIKIATSVNQFAPAAKNNQINST